MSDRDALKADFLRRSGWASGIRHPMTGDLSDRRYERLTLDDGRSAILMDAPPQSNPATPAFVFMTGWLRDAGLSAPAVLASDIDNGLLLLEDLGDEKVSDLVQSDPTLRHAIYDAVLDLLILIRARTSPGLPCPDASELMRMTTLADQFYPGVAPDGLSAFRTLLQGVLNDLLDAETSVSLRDFHADNLMWLPDRVGLARIGLLDYQDAFLTHPVYDLVSLLTDARIRIEPDFRAEMVNAYAARSLDDPQTLKLAFAAFSAQRNLRILGIFARAARTSGKTMHLEKLPRVFDYFAEALRHPVFAKVSEEALASIPRPTPDIIEALR